MIECKPISFIIPANSTGAEKSFFPEFNHDILYVNIGNLAGFNAFVTLERDGIVYQSVYIQEKTTVNYPIRFIIPTGVSPCILKVQTPVTGEKIFCNIILVENGKK
jgi:hypothetical protein